MSLGVSAVEQAKREAGLFSQPLYTTIRIIVGTLKNFGQVVTSLTSLPLVGR